MKLISQCEINTFKPGDLKNGSQLILNGAISCGTTGKDILMWRSCRK